MSAEQELPSAAAPGTVEQSEETIAPPATSNDNQSHDASASSAATGEGGPGLEEVALNPYVLAAFEQYPKPIRTYVKVDGQTRMNPVTTSREVRALEKCTNVSELVNTLERSKSRLLRTDWYNDVYYNFEPILGGSAEDILVRLNVEEKRQRTSISVQTTDMGSAEVSGKFHNLLKRGWELSAKYTPASAMSGLASWSVNATSHIPYLGDRFDLSYSQFIKSYVLHAAESENVKELKASLSKTSWPSGTQNTLHAGYQRRTMGCRDPTRLPYHVNRDMGATTEKVFVGHEMHYSSLEYHTHPFLRELFALPIRGSDISFTNELAGGWLGGDVSALTQQFQWVHHFPLLSIVNLSLGLKAGAVWNCSSTGERLRANDKLYLGWQHVRGYRAIGPSTLDKSVHGPEGAPSTLRYANTGGNALWAAQAVLTFPFPLMPMNGLVSNHLFFNAGDVQNIPTLKDLQEGWKDLFTNPAASIGAGFTLMQMPVLGGAIGGNGRFEFNVSLPLRFDPAGTGKILTTPANENLWRRFRFGLTWSSAPNNTI